MNLFGSTGPIPEGMSTEAALKNVNYSKTYKRIKDKLVVLADNFKKEKGYTPPYWELVKLARVAENQE